MCTAAVNFVTERFTRSELGRRSYVKPLRGSQEVERYCRNIAAEVDGAMTLPRNEESIKSNQPDTPSVNWVHRRSVEDGDDDTDDTVRHVSQAPNPARNV